MKLDVLYVQYTNPGAYPPMINGSRLLAYAGQHVVFAGVGGGGLDALTVPPHPRIEVRLLPWARPGWRQKLHYLRFCGWVIGLALRHRPRWVYASDVLACLPAAVLKRLGFRVLYHEHDHPGTPATPFMRAAMAARRWLARRCPCVLPNAGRAKLFQTETGSGPPLVVWNTPRREEIDSPANPPADCTRILYHGSVVPQRVPETLIEALARTPDAVRLRIVGYETVGAVGYVERLKSLAAERGVAGRVEFRPPLPRSELLPACRDVHVGLGLMPAAGGDVSMENMIGASVKVFDYLSQGVPLLVSDKPDWRAEYVDGGFGLACDPADPASIAEAFRWFHDHASAARAMGERGRQRVLAEWNYETQFGPVLKLLAGRTT